jgi:hypothetical protein
MTHTGQPSDTSPDAQRVLTECYRRMPRARKWAVLADAYRFARALHASGVRLRHPGATAAMIHTNWRAITLGPLGKQLPEGSAQIPETYDFPSAARTVLSALHHLSIPCALSGSLASSIYGVPRFDLNADLVAEPFPDRAASFVRYLGPEYYVSLPAVQDAIRNRASFNIIHLPTAFKVDVFVRQDQPFDQSVLQRRTAIPAPDAPGETIDVVTPEDIVLLKLEWYRLGGGTSDRQWGDVLGVLRVHAGRLDDAYLDRWAADLGVADLLAQARAGAAAAGRA